MSNLTNEFKVKIEAKISQIEKKSELEIVPVIVERSSDYYAWRFNLSVMAGVICLYGLYLSSPTSIHASHWFLSIAASIATWLLLHWKRLLIMLTPRRVFLEAVQDEAAQWFLQEEVFNTRNRTGLLIFISEMESAAFILADKGLLRVIPDSRWALLGQQLATDFSQMSAGESFIRTLDEIEGELSSHFPASTNNQNEISDKVRGS
jgi:putative membrane protein